MPLKLGTCGTLMQRSVDALSEAQAKDRAAIYKALGDAIENYIQLLLVQLLVVIPPTPGLGTSTAPGNPTGPGPAPIPLPGAVLFK
jgi:hypothetical protein